MSTRGIAVISGSNTVVARILENGTAVFGADKPIDLRISGNLVVNLTGSTSGYLYVDNQGSASITSALIGNISASTVAVVPSGNLSSTNVQAALEELQSDINNVGIIREIQAGSNIGVTGGTSPTASIFLSSSLTGLNSIQVNQITASSILAQYFTGSHADVDFIDFKGYPGEAPWQTGRLYYNTASNLLSVYTEYPNTHIHLGQQVVARVQNDLSITIAKGKVVYITGSTSSDTPRVVTASWENDTYSARTLGLAMNDILPGERGYAILQGLLEGLDTNGFLPGQLVYLSSSGNITNIQPPAPYHEVRIGEVIRKNQNNGSIFVRIQNGYELSELHDVELLNVQNGDLLTYSTSSFNQWVNSKTLNGSYTITNDLTASNIKVTTISASQYIGITAGATPGGTNQAVQFNSGSSLSGSSLLTYDYNINVLSGTTAQFTIVTASFVGSGAGLSNLTASNISNFTSDVRNQFSAGSGIVINSGVISASNIPLSSLATSSFTLGSTNISLGTTTTTVQGITVLTGSTITGSTALFTSITGNLFGTASFASNAGNASTVTNGVYLNSNNTFTGINTFNTYITGSITGSDAKFTSISGSFSGSGASLINLTASGISNFASDVRGQFGAGTGIVINAGIISASNVPNSSLQNSSINLNGNNLSLGGTGSVGIIREIQAGSNIGITGGTSATASIFLSSSLTGLTSVSATTLSGTTGQFATITASNITIGDPEDGTYTDGLFTTFTSLTPIGLVVDRFNEVLKGLAPSQAPSLANLERNTAGGNNAILSFGATSPTASYFNVTASLAGLANTDIGGTYSVINGAGGNPIRLGIFTALTALTATLNNNTTANAGSFTNYPAKAFNVSPDGIGSFIIEMNDVVLTPTGSTTTTASYTANNFALSLANTASFISTGLGFDLFRHRTGSVSIPTASWRLGENYFKVTQVSSLGTQVTNYVDWVYDPQAAAGNSVYGFTTTSSSFTVSGLKELSGIKYYQTCSFNFTSSISNYYKNVYSTAANGGITFGSLTTGLAATAFASTPVPTNSDNILQRSSLHTLSGVRVLGATLTSTMTVNNGFGKTGTSVLTTPTILFDNINTGNTTVLENFCFEDFRVISASYNTQAELTTAGNYPSGSALSASELAVYNGGVAYPTTVLNAGNVAGSGVVYLVAGQPNYAGVVQDRFYLRRFVNGVSALATFNLILTGSNINFTAFGGALTGNNIKISVKVPGKTGWRDVLTAAPANTTGIALNDNVGCLAGSAPANITTSAGRSIAINLLTEAVGSSESYIVRVLASSGWTGSITRIQIA